MKDTRDAPPLPWTNKARETARTWYEGMDLKMAESIEVGKLIEYPVLERLNRLYRGGLNGRRAIQDKREEQRVASV